MAEKAVRLGKWVMQVKHEKGVPDDHIEVSVIRKRYELGFSSWGWDGENKMILPVTKLKKMKRLARIIADALNHDEEK